MERGLRGTHGSNLSNLSNTTSARACLRVIRATPAQAPYAMMQCVNCVNFQRDPARETARHAKLQFEPQTTEHNYCGSAALARVLPTATHSIFNHMPPT
eukprot:9035943-Alexandrium_andersonii.AAC.1